MLCDGGVVANNPSAEAVAFTSVAYGDEKGLWDLKVPYPGACVPACAQLNGAGLCFAF